ncbi:MAG: beta-N-acetylhexosaminidase [Flavobacteriaceae bacterium]|nr:beta-N-acetylhexosaminidase [Flavobacteriaceae bacterium]
MYRKIAFVFLILRIFASSAQSIIPIIPNPKFLSLDEASPFSLTKQTVLIAPKGNLEVQYLKEIIKKQLGYELATAKVAQKSKNSIELTLDSSLKMDIEEYKIEIDSNKIHIQASNSNGLFYGIQTLNQLIEYYSKTNSLIPALTILDQPKYKWRGMHLDVVRHFFQKSDIKKYIDYLALYKMNVFHWHLTDDQGWRIEIKKYPKLTSVGAFRKESMVGHYNEQLFDGKPYGGFYTQEDIKEIVAYAKQKHITVVPEIEMPGHATAALAAYPEFSCTGGPFEVGTKWGVLDDVFCPNENTLYFLKAVLEEVLPLFPSEYIHIGGDECPKTRWHQCAKCQALIKQEGLKDEHELQSYFVSQIEKHINKKGKKIIGWDEILDGGLAPNAAVMSWRGTEGGIAAAKAKHFVVMSPGSHCYFDHYQGEQKTEPLAIGGYTPLEMVYDFNPIPTELTADESQYILGAQGNVWTEYMGDFAKVEYMAMPRMAALSEVLWGKDSTSNYTNFRNRLQLHFSLLDKMNVNYSKALFEVKAKITASATHLLEVELVAAIPSFSILYSLDGTQPTSRSLVYTKPITIEKNTTLKAVSFEGATQKSAVLEQKFEIHLATGAIVKLNGEPSNSYKAYGAFSLVDGMYGDRGKFGRDWLGFSGKDAIATIDLGSVKKVHSITIDVLSSPASWIYYPKQITISYSKNGIDYSDELSILGQEIEDSKGIVKVAIPNATLRYIKVNAFNQGKIVAGNPGAGEPAWLFIDEIKVD